MAEIKKLLVVPGLLFFVFQSFAVYSQSTADSLLNRLNDLDTTNVEHVKESVNIFNKLSFEYLYNDTNKAFSYAQKAIKRAQSVDYKEGIGNSYYTLSYYYVQKNKSDSALHYALKSYSQFNALNDTSGIISALNVEALSYLSDQNYSLALEKYLSILPMIYKFEGEGYKLAKIRGNIGYIYNQLEQYDKAIESYRYALNFAVKNDNQQGKAFFLGNLAGVFRDKGNYDKAKEYYKQSLELSQKLNDKHGIGIAKYNLGKIYRLEGKLRSAKKIIRASIIPLEKVGTNRFLTNAYQELGWVFYDQNKYQRAIDTFEVALEYADKSENIKLRYVTINAIAKTYEKKGDYSKALFFLKKHNELKETYSQKIQASKVSNLNQQFELKNKDLKIQLLQNERELQEARMDSEKTLRNAILVGSGLLLIILLLIGNGYRLKKKSEEKLKEKNEKLNKLNEDKNMFVRMAAHDLKSPLSAISGIAELIKLDLDEVEGQEISSYADQILLVSDRMLKIIKNLLNVESIESGEQITRPKRINLYPYIKKIIKDHEIQAQKKDIHLHYDSFSKELPVLANEPALDGILENLISNAIKYSPQHKNIWIKAYKSNGSTCVEVKDEGPGIADEEKEQLFKKYSILSAEPTGGEYSNGLGLYIVKNLIDQLDGVITLESKEGEGATFKIELPKA